MTRGEAIKDFFYKTILPVAAAALLYCIFRSACVKNGELDYLWLWILCGLPFGIWRLRLWIIPGGGSLGSGIALFALNFILAGIIGGFVLVWRLIVAVWYVPLTVWRCLFILISLVNYRSKINPYYSLDNFLVCHFHNRKFTIIIALLPLLSPLLFLPTLSSLLLFFVPYICGYLLAFSPVFPAF